MTPVTCTCACGVRPLDPEVLCGAPAIKTVTTGCKHEHLRENTLLCARCYTGLQTGGTACGICLFEHGHNCPVMVFSDSAVLVAAQDDL